MTSLSLSLAQLCSAKCIVIYVALHFIVSESNVQMVIVCQLPRLRAMIFECEALEKVHLIYIYAKKKLLLLYGCDGVHD